MTTDTHRHAAEARTRRGLSTHDVAAALGIAPAAYAQWESGAPSAWRPSSIELASLAGILTVTVLDLLGATYLTASDSLAPLWAQWGTSGAGQRAALTQVSGWARLDDQISAAATPGTSTWDSVAARGIPESPTSVFDLCTLPLLPAPSPTGSYVELAEQARDLAARVAGAWQVSAGSVDPWQVADTFGVPAGLAPLGDQMFAATIRTGGGYAIVVNSDVTDPWRTQTLTHALVHLTFGHPALGSFQPIPDRDDDSIYACAGWDHRVCGLLEHVSGWLTDPTDSEQALAAARDDSAAWQPPTRPGPVRAHGEQAGYWEQYDVHVRPVTLRRELDLHHECLVVPGPGEQRWPASLARRWVAATARGHTLDVRATRSFPYGTPGCPAPADVETALTQAHVIAAQLTAWNQSQFDERAAH